ncbi:MAG: TIGR03016 family PEP-CTERM system-associated outer membrane protein [Nitrospirae bacterium]|nr:TIGR03016 family PEP-CTERM system-associated outer membrane protein [Nitrospirota bacterium]
MRTTDAAAVIFVFMFFFAALPALSEAEVSFTPSISLREEYNDNIFLTSYDEEGDFLTTVNPAIALTYSSGKEDLTLDYGVYFDFYADNSDRNDVRQLGRLVSTTSLYKDVFFLKVTDVYARVPIDERRPVALDNLLVNTTDSNRFAVNPYVEYPLSGTLMVRAGYTYENLWYEEEDGDRSESNSAELSVIKEMSSVMTSYLTFNYLSRRPEITEAYDRQDAGLSIEYRIGPRITLNAGAGRTSFKYKMGTELDSTVWNTRADYSLTEGLVFSAGYSVGFFDSVNVGAYKRKASTGSISYSGRNTLKLSVFNNVDRYLTFDREDKARGVIIDSSIPVTSRITGVLTGRYTKYDFLPEEENVERYSVGLSFHYELRSLAAILGYSHNLSDSVVDARDYRSNIAWLQVRLAI